MQVWEAIFQGLSEDTREESDHFAMKEKLHERTKRQGTTTMYISFSTEKNTF